MPILNLLPIYCYLNWVRSSHSFKFWAVILCFLSYDIIGPFQISFSTFDFSLQLTSLSSMLSTWIDIDLWQKAIYFHKVKSSDVIIGVEDFNIQIGNDRDQNEKHLSESHSTLTDRTDSGKCLLQLHRDNRLFLVSTNFKHEERYHPTWWPPKSTRRWM